MLSIRRCYDLDSSKRSCQYVFDIEQAFRSITQPV